MHAQSWLTVGAALVATAWAMPVCVRNMSSPSLIEPFNGSHPRTFTASAKAPRILPHKRIRPSIMGLPLGFQNSSRANMRVPPGGQEPGKDFPLPSANSAIPFAGTAGAETPYAAIKYNSKPTGQGKSESNRTDRDTKEFEENVAELNQRLRQWQKSPKANATNREQVGLAALSKIVNTSHTPVGPYPLGKNATIVRPMVKPFSATGHYRKSKWGFLSGNDAPYNATWRTTQPSAGERNGTGPNSRLDAQGPASHLDPTPYFATRPGAAPPLAKDVPASTLEELPAPAVDAGPEPAAAEPSDPAVAPGAPPFGSTTTTTTAPADSLSRGLVLVIDGTVDVVRNNATHLKLAAKAGGVPAPSAGTAGRLVGQDGSAEQALAAGSGENCPHGDCEYLAWLNRNRGNQGCGCQGWGCGSQGGGCGCNRCPCNGGCGCS